MAAGIDEKTAQLRRSYGRGFFDAVKALGADMNLAKMRQMEQALNGQAKKVYDAIPIETSVSLSELITKLATSMGRPDHRVIDGCANDIVDRGLARKTTDGKFQRNAPRLAVPEDSKDSTDMTELKAVPARDFPRNPSPFTQLRARITEITNALAEVERLANQIEGESGKLMKLKDALDSLR